MNVAPFPGVICVYWPAPSRCSPGANQYVAPGWPKFTCESSPAWTTTAAAGADDGPLSSWEFPHTALGGGLT